MIGYGYTLPTKLINLTFDNILDFATHLDIKDQASLYTSHSTFKSAIISRTPKFNKAKELYKYCPKWITRRVFGDAWVIFTAREEHFVKPPSLECLKSMKANVEILNNLEQLNLNFESGYYEDQYLDALSDLLKAKSFSELTIHLLYVYHYPYNHITDKLFSILKYCNCSTLKIYSIHFKPSSDAFKNLALNQNIKHIELSPNLLPLFINHYQHFKGVESIHSSTESLSVDQRDKLKLFTALKYIYISNNGFNSLDPSIELLSNNTFQGFYMKINQHQERINLNPIQSLKLELMCHTCNEIDIGLIHSITTLKTLHIILIDESIRFNPPFIHNFLIQSKVLDSLTLDFQKFSQIRGLFMYTHLNLKSLVLRFNPQYMKITDSFFKFLGSQINLHSFEMEGSLFFLNTQPIVISRILSCLNTLKALKTIHFKFKFETRKFNSFLAGFIESVKEFGDKDLLINGVYLNSIVNRLNALKVPLDILDKSIVYMN